MSTQAKKRKEKVNYSISFKTSEAHKNAGISKKIKMELVGSNGKSTGFLPICRPSQKKNKKGKHDISAKNVGLPILIRISPKKKRLGGKSKWFCDYVDVSIEGDLEKVRFPVYDWIVDEIEVARGKATIYQKINDEEVKKARKKEVEKNKTTFQWVAKPRKGNLTYGLPRFCKPFKGKALPLILQWDQTRKDDFDWSLFKGGVKVAWNAIWSKVKSFVTGQSMHFSDYEPLYKHVNVSTDNPAYIKDWESDETMGRQILTGISPLIISRCTTIPSYFKVTHDVVANLLENGKSLEDEMRDGKVYICDCVSLTTVISRNKDLKCADCVGLFYVKGEDFVPIAIQLFPNKPKQIQQVHDNQEHLFTPNDDEYDWLLAKMHFRCSTTSIHQWVYHFLYTHNIMEPFCVALFRCLPRAHPVYKLLRPHLQTVCDINTKARENLLPPKSLANKTISLSATDTGRVFFKEFQFKNLVIPELLKEQGTDDPDKLPGYYYRDDALRIWKIMESFVGNLLRHYYASDSEVAQDDELQDWIKNVADEGLNWQENNRKERKESNGKEKKQESNRCPNELITIDQLIEVCVTVMFTSSAQHAAVNFGQFETYKFAPNSPSCMRKHPHKIGEGNEKFALESLPNRKQASSIVILSYVLSKKADNEVFIGEFPDNFFDESEVTKMQKVYTKELEQLEKDIKNRNKKLSPEKQYKLLLPSNVPKSIGI